MSRTIWVHRIPVDAISASFTNVVHMPEGSRLIHCREQYGNIALWFEVDTEASKVQRKFQIYGTGHTIPDDLFYRGTCVFAGGDLILHVYEVST